ncbi:MAG: Cytochrome c oxidase assembly protein cox19 [Chrysothrix sp. TS-e1954]|nr:MAG: Cytochrome c oxidase assembly protein cox19 [Chrysothrix sp. TS-e1954]
MSTFGSPGGRQQMSRPSPPERGSFPLDHDGECATFIKEYLTCLKGVRGTNAEECRKLSMNYLECRMDKNLMARDERKNLGFAKWGNEADVAMRAQSKDNNGS